MQIRVMILPTVLIVATGCSPQSSPQESDAPPVTTSATATAAATTPAPATATDGPVLELTTADAMETVDEFFAAYDVGDIAGMVDLMTSDVRIDGEVGEDVVEGWRLLYEWTHAQQSEMVSRDCEATHGTMTDRVLVTCRYGHRQHLARVVGGPPVPSTTMFVVAQEGIVELHDQYGDPGFLVVDRPFAAWMRAHHPEDADAVGCCGGDSVQDAREKGLMRAQYAVLWAAWLDGHPDCTWSDVSCQSDGG